MQAKLYFSALRIRPKASAKPLSVTAMTAVAFPQSFPSSSFESPHGRTATPHLPQTNSVSLTVFGEASQAVITQKALPSSAHALTLSKPLTVFRALLQIVRRSAVFLFFSKLIRHHSVNAFFYPA